MRTSHSKNNVKTQLPFLPRFFLPLIKDFLPDFSVLDPCKPFLAGFAVCLQKSASAIKETAFSFYRPIPLSGKSYRLLEQDITGYLLKFPFSTGGDFSGDTHSLHG